MAGESLWRGAAISAQAAALITTLACEVAGPTAPQQRTPPPMDVDAGFGTIGGTVTINGEARPIVWVELQTTGGFPWAYGTTIPNGSWEWERVPARAYVVVVKTPPDVTCDATRKPATVRGDQRTVVNFACVGYTKGWILGFASNEFGAFASARITLTGPLTGETLSNRDGFFAFEGLPPGDYLVGLCAEQRQVSVREGAQAFVTVDCS